MNKNLDNEIEIQENINVDDFEVEPDENNKEDSISYNTYFEKRIYGQLGLKPDENIVKVCKYNHEKHQHSKTLVDFPIFSEDKDGNIKILVWTLDRKTIISDHKDSTADKPNINNDRFQTYYLTRYKNPIRNKKGDEIKYLIPKGIGTFPFFPPQIVEKFEKGKKIDNLVITEGYIKAIKATMHGFDCIGVSSIHHFKNTKTGELHEDITRLIKTCKVKNIYILFDGDCRDLSEKAIKNNEDLYTRINSFYTAAQNAHQLLIDIVKDNDSEIYFSNIDTENHSDKPKGIDDLLISFKGNEEEILNDFKKLNGCQYFIKFLITDNLKKLRRYFNLDNPVLFYDFYKDLLLDKEFLFNGTRYQFNKDNSELEIKMPAAAKNYMRVGTDYFKKVHVPNKEGIINTTLRQWKRETIIEDHTKKFIEHIPKYESFCSIPEHLNYQEVHSNCYNKYFAFEYEPEEGDCSITLDFMKHIFAEQLELGLDYIQLLYQKPIQILPILSLVSRERHTGKTTFINYLSRLFKNNCLSVGNEDLSNPFNAAWYGKLLIYCEETLVDKKPTGEKIKHLSTAQDMLMNAKGKDQINVDAFMKFIFCSNNEDSFFIIDREEIRFWVRKIKVPKEINTDLLEDLTREIPYFINYLNKRKLSTKKESRAWFAPYLLVTEALRKVQENSRPQVEKTIQLKIKDLLIDLNLNQILMTSKKISELFFNKRYDEYYIARILRDNLKIEQYKKDGEVKVTQYYYPNGDINPSDGSPIMIKDIGRPYVFEKDDFVLVNEKIGYEVEIKNKSGKEPF